MVECKDKFPDCADLADPNGFYGGCNGNLNGQDGGTIHIGRDWCPATCDQCGSPDDGDGGEDNVIQGKVSSTRA